jgi:acetate---CoA ligase (ADP-forming)
MGVYVRHSHLNALGLVFPLSAGPIGLVTQSGNLGMYFFSQAQLASLGFTAFLSLGNSIDVQFPECLQFLVDDPETSVIAGYIEATIDMEEMRHLMRTMRTQGRYKPIVILLGGSSEVGVRASFAHTGTRISVRRDDDISLRGEWYVNLINPFLCRLSMHITKILRLLYYEVREFHIMSQLRLHVELWPHYPR